MSASGPTATLPPPPPTGAVPPTTAPEPPATGENDGGTTSIAGPAPPPPARGQSVETVIVVPSGDPPELPDEIQEATISPARNPRPREVQLLVAIGNALAAQAEQVYYVETPKGLEVGKAAPLILGLKAPVRLPPTVAALARGRKQLGIEMTIFPYGKPSMEFVEQGEPANFVLDFPSRTLEAFSPTGELARFDVTADETGTHGVWIVLARPDLGRGEVDYNVSLPVRDVDVGGEGISDRLLALLLSAALVVGALTEVVVKPVRGVWSLLRKRPEGQKPSTGRQA